MHDNQTLAATLSPWLRAFIESTVATLLCFLVTGALFLPKELARMQEKGLSESSFAHRHPTDNR